MLNALRGTNAAGAAIAQALAFLREAPGSSDRPNPSPFGSRAASPPGPSTPETHRAMREPQEDRT
jgi:hypothetical protein